MTGCRDMTADGRGYPAGDYARQLDALGAALPGAGLDWLAEVRRRAGAGNAGEGRPSRRIEEWRYTDLAPLARAAYAPAPKAEDETEAGIDASTIAALTLATEPACHLLVFVDGRLRPALSDVAPLPEGARIASLAEMLEACPERLDPHLAPDRAASGAAPVALNAALMTDGAVLMLDDGVTLDRPLHLIFLASGRATPAASHLRNLIVAGRGSAATVIETYAAPRGGDYWTNAVTDVALDAGATIRHVRLQGEGDEAIHLAATRVALARDSAYRAFSLVTGGRLSRNEIAVRIAGENAESRLSGVALGRARQHMDTTITVDHLAAAGRSEQHFRSVLADAAHGVFQGRITVHRDAQRTDAHQLNKNLLLSDDAAVDAKPELEINADDVKCSHGATVGAIDADALFYLRARGIDESLARRFLIESFVAEVVETLDDAAIAAHVGAAVASWLGAPEIAPKAER